jgi:hypothetical protein
MIFTILARASYWAVVANDQDLFTLLHQVEEF